MSQQLINGKQQFISGSGVPLASGTVAFYLPNTFTPINTYQDSALSILNTNPVTLDGNGYASIWGADGQFYRQIVKDSLGNQIWDSVVGGTTANYALSSMVSALANQIPMALVIVTTATMPAISNNTAYENRYSSGSSYWSLTGMANGWIIRISNNVAQSLTLTTGVGTFAGAYGNGTNTLVLNGIQNLVMWWDGANWIVETNSSSVLALSGGTITGNLTVSGNSVFSGNVTVLNATQNQNPVALGQVTSLVQTNAIQIEPLNVSIGSNALTINSQSYALQFKTSLTSGAVTSITQSPASLTIPSGATLGTISGQLSTLAVIVMNNSGTLQYGVTNLAGGVDLSETGLISTTAISSVATSASTVYSNTALTTVPYRVVGFIQSTQTTAGTWATSPSLLQGVGGQAFNNMQTLGIGQTPQNVTSNRTPGVLYYNTTNKPISIYVTFYTGATTYHYIYVNGVSLPQGQTNPNSPTVQISAVVPPFASYSTSNNGSLIYWAELR